MLAPVVLSLLIGMVLAQRFKVLILFPAFALAFILAVATVIGRSDAAWTAGVIATVLISGLQIGYLFGIGVRHVNLVARASRLRATMPGNSLTPRRPVH